MYARMHARRQPEQKARTHNTVASIFARMHAAMQPKTWPTGADGADTIDRVHRWMVGMYGMRTCPRHNLQTQTQAHTTWRRH